MNLKQLRELAEAGKEEKTNPKGRLHFHIVEFYNAITPQTILALLDLVDTMHSALCMVTQDLEGAKVRDEAMLLSALNGYLEFNKEQT